MMIEDALYDSCVLSDLKGTNKKDVISELVGTLKNAGLIEDEEKAVHVVLEREKLGSTGIGDGVAIPHGKLKEMRDIVCAFGRSKQGIDFDAVDKKPSHIFFLLLAPENSASQHLMMLSRISKLLRDPSFRKGLVETGNAADLYARVIEEDRRLS